MDFITDKYQFYTYMVVHIPKTVAMIKSVKRTLRYHHNQIDLEVITRQAWSLTPDEATLIFCKIQRHQQEKHK